MDPETTADSGIDIEATVADIGRDLGFDTPEPELETPEAEEPDLVAAVADTVAAEKEQVAQPVVREMPKSWKKEKAEVWSKMPDDAKDYYIEREKQFLDGLEQYKGDAGYAKELKEVIAPYKAFLAAQGVTEKQAVQQIMNAHYRLTNGTLEERRAAYQQIGQELKIMEAQAADPNAPQLSPELKKLQDDVNSIRSTITATQKAELTRAEADAAREIEAFSSDAANVYFNDVAQDMVPLLKQGLALKDAYDKAVWGNPVTRQKELNRIQTEAEANRKAKAKQEADTAKRATSSNVRGVESRKAPTEPKGSMEDTMRDTLKTIRERAH